MSIPGSASPLFFQTAAAAAAAAAGPTKSLRFDSGDSSYLSKTFSSAGNRKTFTFACWLKRSSLGGRQTLLRTNSSELHFSFAESAQGNEDAFFCYGAGGSPYLVSDAVFKDISGWYHFCIAWDTTQSTSTDRLKLYVNGVRITSWKTSTFPNQNYEGGLNSATAHGLGANSSGGERFDGYMTDVYFIDGTAHDPTSFGSFDDSGVWQASAFSGTYGSNGFHLLDFANESTIGHDSSGNNFDWSNHNFTAIDGRNESTSNFSGSGTTHGSITAILDNDTTTGYGVQAGTLTYTPASAITVSSQIKFWYSTDQSNTRFRVNSGSWITLSDPSGVGTYTHSFSGSLTKIEWNAPSSGELISVHQIEIDSQTLVSATALLDNDISFDAPTNGDQTDTGAGGEVSGNYCVFNSYSRRLGNLSDGNLKTAFPSDSTRAEGTIAVKSGKFYWEAEAITNMQTHTIGGRIGICQSNTLQISSAENVEFDCDWHANSGVRVRRQGYSSVAVGSGTNYNDGDIIGVALDVDNSTVRFYKNGSLAYNIDFSSYVTAGSAFLTAHSWGYFTSTWVYNFGARGFAYSAPSGYKAFCTTNLTTPTISDASDYFDTVLYTGNGGSQSITSLDFSPSFVWIKNRSSFTNQTHAWFDVIRGKEMLASSSTNSESDWHGSNNLPYRGYVDSFDSNGFSLVPNSASNLADYVNYNNTTYVAWSWNGGSSTATNTDGSITSSVRASQSSGFSIVAWTGTNSAGTIGHGLNAVPEMIIVKNRNNVTGSNGWQVYHSALGNTKPVGLHTDAAPPGGNSAYWNNTSPTNSVFSVGNSDAMNGGYGNTYIGYCFAPVDGFSAFGVYEGNGSTSKGPFIYTGFPPAFLMFRRYNSTGDWIMFDNKRNTHEGNYRERVVYANEGTPEEDAANGDTHLFLSNGFAIDNVNFGFWNATNDDYLWAAFAENPFQANGGTAR